MFELLLRHSPWAYRSGELAFASGWPLWLLFALIAAGAAAVTASLLRKPMLWGQRLAIGALQSLVLAIVLVLLWRPVLNVERVRDRQNVVAIVLDTSASMASADGERSRMQEAVQTLRDGPLDALRKTFGVRLAGFSDGVRTLESLDAVPRPGPQTRIGAALREVLQMAGSVPLAGVVLVSDGAENGGTLGEDQLAEIAAFGVPIHTVGVGPERVDDDLELESVSLAPEAVPGSTVAAEVSIRHNGQARTRLRVYDGDKLLAARELELAADAGVTTRSIDLPTGESGVRNLRFTLDPIEGERNTINNRRSQVVDVAARRRNIFYMEGEPRWEYKFIRRAAESDRSLRLASVVRATPNRYYRQGVESAEELREGFPTRAEDLFAYDAVVIGSLEAAALSREQQQMLYDFVDRRGGGLLMLAGRDGLADGGWSRTPVAVALPAHLPGDTTKTFARSPIKAQLTSYGGESAISRLDDDPTRNLKLWSELPPLADFQPLGRLKPGAIVLLEADAGKRRTPLLAWQHFGRGTSYMLGTASTWRWQMRLPAGDTRHDTFWRQLLHAVAADAVPRASLTSERKVYDDERRITLNAELRNERFEPIDDATVDVSVTSERGEPFVVTMQSSGQHDGRYSAVVDAENAGLYRFDMAARAGDRTIASATTHVQRNVGVVEHFGAQQNRPLLERIARMSGGRYWRPQDLGGLADAMRYSKAGIVERQTLDLWNVPLVFLVLLALKGAEWLLRLRWKKL